jgi:hypothetical protein
MVGHRHRNGALRLIVIDFVLAVALIWTSVLVAGLARGRAHAAGPATAGALVQSLAAHAPQSQPVGVQGARYTRERVGSSRLETYLALSLSVAALAALNLAFWRHLRRAYASPRRSRWRRG